MGALVQKQRRFIFIHDLNGLVGYLGPVVRWHEVGNLKLRARITEGCISDGVDDYASLRVCRSEIEVTGDGLGRWRGVRTIIIR